MANKTINDLTEEASPASGDFIPMWKTASGVTRKVNKSNLIGATLTGGGTIATGGFTLTVPATGTAALLEKAQTFTKTQTIQPDSAGTDGLVVNMPSGVAADAIEIQYNGERRQAAAASGAGNIYFLLGFDNGTGSGPRVNIGGNTNASTPAPGCITINALSFFYSYYPDDSGVLRVLTNAQPTNANMASGTVVGSQTSMAAAKYLQDSLSAMDEVLARIEMGANAVRRFTYKSGAFDGQEFEGVVTDYAPEYGMDRTEEHPEGQALNEIQIMGDLLRAVAWLTERVRQLETSLTDR